VRAFVRDVEKLPEDVRSKVEPFKGDVLNIDDVRKAIQGQDGAIVVLGTRNDLCKCVLGNFPTMLKHILIFSCHDHDVRGDEKYCFVHD
jgi:pSer/pThr/pTyr-binding forkhead associated (FHA) protein